MLVLGARNFHYVASFFLFWSFSSFELNISTSKFTLSVGKYATVLKLVGPTREKLDNQIIDVVLTFATWVGFTIIQWNLRLLWSCNKKTPSPAVFLTCPLTCVFTYFLATFYEHLHDQVLWDLLVARNSCKKKLSKQTTKTAIRFESENVSSCLQV